MGVGRRMAFVLVSSAFVLLGGAPAGAGPAAYRLGPQDRLQIKVYDWRTGTGEAHDWPALNGEFVVGASGTLSLPLLGEVAAFDKTPAEVADYIADRLQSKVGLAQRPDASVEVVKYRPFYILGDVDKPGEYDYRPDLSVIQAVSTAGGLARLSDANLLGFERDALVSRGDLRTMDVERIGLLARQARLDAEITGTERVTFPAEVTGRSADPSVERTLREERLLFEAHRSADRSQSEALAQSKELLTRELASLSAKDASLGRQLDVTRKELDQISGLVSKGLAVLPRQLEIERSAAQFESSRLDIQLALLRAQQDLAKAESDRKTIENKRRSDALSEAAEVRAKLADLSERIETAQRLIYQTEVRAPAVIAEAAEQRPPVYLLTRKVDGKPETRTVGESDPVQPGDIIRIDVQRRSPRAGPKGEPGTADAGTTGKAQTGVASTF
jgi:exopolysaccharide production protein ExoF